MKFSFDRNVKLKLSLSWKCLGEQAAQMQERQACLAKFICGVEEVCASFEKVDETKIDWPSEWRVSRCSSILVQFLPTQKVACNHSSPNFYFLLLVCTEFYSNTGLCFLVDFDKKACQAKIC